MVSVVSSTSTGWTAASGASKTTSSISVQAGDLIVVTASGEDYNTVGTLTVSGGGLSWAHPQTVFINDYCPITVAYATATSSTSITVTVTRGSNPAWSSVFGCVAHVVRGHGGVGVSNKGNAASGDPSTTLNGCTAGSLIFMAVGDWSAVNGASRAYNTGPASFNETAYGFFSGTMTEYNGHYSALASGGNKTVGITDPNGMQWSIVALEVLAGGSTPKTLSSGIDLAVQAGGTAGATIDLAIGDSPAAVIGLDMTVLGPSQVFASIDVSIAAARSAAAQLDLAICALLEMPASLDVAVLAELSASTALDLYVSGGPLVVTPDHRVGGHALGARAGVQGLAARRLAAIVLSRSGSQVLGKRVDVQALGARTGQQSIGARTGPQSLGPRASAHVIGSRSREQP